jgi:Domain of unknown function (DUF4872)/Butirosin biosynthesis protein H, N-terminal
VPRQKNFKRLVRDRMEKTGESYTTARSRFEPPVAAEQPAPGDPDAGALARALAGAGFANPATGLPYTEALLFGAGGGIGFAYLVFAYEGWTTVHLEGRSNALYFEKKSFVEVACDRLGLPLTVRPTASAEPTAKQLRQALAGGAEVALTLDLTRMAGGAPGGVPQYPHPVTVAGGEEGVTVTGLPRGRVILDWDELIDARWTGPKKYGGLLRFGPPGEPADVRAGLAAAIGRTADCLLAPSRGNNFDSNFGVPGMRRWTRLLTDERDAKGWPRLFAEPGGRGDALAAVVRGLRGGACRRLYAAFLDEAAGPLGQPGLVEVAEAYRDLAYRWAALVELAARPGATPADLAAPLPDLADAEEAAALALRAAVTNPSRGEAR